MLSKETSFTKSNERIKKNLIQKIKERVLIVWLRFLNVFVRKVVVFVGFDVDDKETYIYLKHSNSM